MLATRFIQPLRALRDGGVANHWAISRKCNTSQACPVTGMDEPAVYERNRNDLDARIDEAEDLDDRHAFAEEDHRVAAEHLFQIPEGDYAFLLPSF